mgnify:FL=1
MLIKITKRENKGLENEHLQFIKVMGDKNVRTGGVKRNEKNKKQVFALLYLVIPACLFGAGIVLGVIREYSLEQIYHNGLGISACYYFLISLFIFIRWKY